MKTDTDIIDSLLKVMPEQRFERLMDDLYQNEFWSDDANILHFYLQWSKKQSNVFKQERLRVIQIQLNEAVAALQNILLEHFSQIAGGGRHRRFALRPEDKHGKVKRYGDDREPKSLKSWNDLKDDLQIAAHKVNVLYQNILRIYKNPIARKRLRDESVSYDHHYDKKSGYLYLPGYKPFRLVTKTTGGKQSQLLEMIYAADNKTVFYKDVAAKLYRDRNDNSRNKIDKVVLPINEKVEEATKGKISDFISVYEDSISIDID